VLFGYPCSNHNKGRRTPAVPSSRIPAESPTKLPLTNNHPLFTTISNVFHSLHRARFLPFIVWIPQIRVASYCGKGGIQNIFWTPRNSYPFPYLPIRTRSSQKSITKRIIAVGGLLLLALVWYIQGRQGVHRNRRYCGVQKIVLNIQTLEDETTTLSRNVGHQLLSAPRLRTEALEDQRASKDVTQ
jgi:hypothetical protein